jgi:hypothetical protein
MVIVHSFWYVYQSVNESSKSNNATDGDSEIPPQKKTPKMIRSWVDGLAQQIQKEPCFRL